VESAERVIDGQTGPRPGELVGEKYRLIEKIGEGGSGRVYRAVNELLNREVAIKVLKPEFAGDETSKKRFFREAKTANRVRHPNVVDVLDVGDSADGPWMVQELLVGEPLSAMLVRDGVMPARRTLELLLPVLSALAVAHSRGIAHRDFKPENVFLVDGPGDATTPKILDFGLSKASVHFGTTRSSDKITAAGVIVGTPAYLSPERARSDSEGDARGDVWAIGVVLYECATGELPMPSTNLREMFVHICRGDVIPIVDALPEIDPEFAAIVMRCLRANPDDRYPSAAELVEDVHRYLGDQAIGQGAVEPGANRSGGHSASRAAASIAARDSTSPELVATDDHVPLATTGAGRFHELPLELATTMRDMPPSNAAPPSIAPVEPAIEEKREASPPARKPRTMTIVAVLLALVTLALIAYSQASALRDIPRNRTPASPTRAP
jgi:serine/threonine protein kinase